MAERHIGQFYEYFNELDISIEQFQSMEHLSLIAFNKSIIRFITKLEKCGHGLFFIGILFIPWEFFFFRFCLS